ncbi:MAG: T9SS type A sorting domain-containing protein, partial [Bacteroidales bacterium]|nr:T9SS type A sorting domain-containing protein [Bacteroidales bacterium]
YTLEIHDNLHMGFDYMFFNDFVKGYIKVLNDEDQVVKVLEPEFGKTLKYAFRIGDVTYIEESNLDLLFDLYPNPADSKLILKSDKLEGDIRIEVYGLNGNLIYTADEPVNQYFEKQLDVSSWTPGFYVAVIKTNDGIFKRKFIVE